MSVCKIFPRRILIINTFGIGDVLFTTPLISNLRLQFPRAHIAYLGNKRTAPLLRDYKKIDQVFEYERDAFNAIYKRSKWDFLKTLYAFLCSIKKENFDVVFDFSMNSPINFFTRLVGIKQRIGFNYKGRSPFLTLGIPFKGFESQHVVQYYLDLIEGLGVEIKNRALELTISPENKDWVDGFLCSQGISPSDRLVGILPGGGLSWGQQAKYRRWSTEKYAKLVDKTIDIYSVKIILLGDHNEIPLCEAIVKGRKDKVIQACGKTSLGQLAALIERCELIVLNDGGALHIAVGVGTKTVSLFGPVDPSVYGPFGSPEDHLIVCKDFICSPCYRRFRMTKCEHVTCLKSIEVDDVFEKVAEQLDHIEFIAKT